MILPVAIGVVLAFGLGALLGAPYLPVLGRDVQSLLDLSGLKSGQSLIDLGCGDGRLLRAAARRGISGLGYEINPILFIIAVVYCWPQRKQVRIKLGNYWLSKLPPADGIYVFLIDRYMSKLDRKLSAEITTPTTVVSYIFKVPNVEPIKSSKNSYVYHYPKSSS